MEDGVRGHSSKVKTLIEKAVNSTAAEVDPRLLKAIKSMVRYSDSELELAAQTLMDLMKRDHAQVRILTLLIIDELFMRSKLFRTLLVGYLDQLLALSVGFRRNLPLPGPPSVASILRKKAIEFLEKWKESFGIHYRQLRLGYDYLKNTLRFQFPNIQANAARLQQERREREIRSKEICLNKYERLRADFSVIKEEIKSTVDEIGECLDILISKPEPVPLHLLDDEEYEEFRSTELRQIRVDALKEAEKIRENTDNKVVFDTLRELYKLLVTKHLISIQEWISVLVRVEVADTISRDSILKELIDIQNCLKSVRKHCEEAGCALPRNVKQDEEQQDFWEAGKVEVCESVRSVTVSKNCDLQSASTSQATSSDNYFHDKESTERKSLACEGNDSGSNSLRSKLLAEAPVINWGSYLDSWGLKRVVLANQRGLEFESHWGRVDYDAVIPSEKIDELNLQAIPYKEDPVEIQPCCAPLSKGGLCQRRDLKVCPFHGPKIPRDEEGKPLDPCASEENFPSPSSSPSPSVEKMNESSDLVEQLAKQAVKNVRQRDSEIANCKEADKRALKRAKLAKIREHNEAVLREAALASSRYGCLGEGAEGTNRENLSTRNSKQTLASMLRKKVTSKDRIGRKLLNTRATDATTRQLASAEEADYREAFPNQW